MARPLYEVAPGQKFYDNWKMHEAGDKVEYDGATGENLVPVNAEAKKAKAAAGKGVTAPAPLTADERRELELLRAEKAERDGKE